MIMDPAARGGEGRSAHLQGVGVFMAKLLHLCNSFLSLLETPEVVLNQERCVELAYSDVIVT